MDRVKVIKNKEIVGYCYSQMIVNNNYFTLCSHFIEIDIQGRLLPVVGFSYTDPKALYLHWSICCPLWIESYYLI